MPELAAIFRYPIKSCRGRRVSAARLDRFGIEGDRRYLIVDGGGRFITQRETPALARIEVEETATHLRLRAPGAEPVCIPLAAAGESRTRREVTIWRDTVTADDLGEPAATWLSRYLGTPARLVTTGKAFHRPIARAPGHETAFADAWPLLVLSEASLQALNERLARPVPLDRFRPNLLVTGCAPFAEDRWRRIRIGEVVLRAAGPCARCVVTTTDQHTLERGPEPLRTLATFRRDAAGHVNFGQNYLHETAGGTLRPGMPIDILD